eukprot:XP_004915886.1 PREDICTED: disintegrin and metalloproteinase domain-containing protein 9-like isoform X1 [Xenopus tropicalis]
MWEPTLLPWLGLLLWGHGISGLAEYEIVFPQLVGTRERRDLHYEEQWSDNLLYSIQTLTHKLLLKLQRNRDLVSSGFERFTYSKEAGFQVFNSTQLSHNCYYYGEVEGMNDSLLAISTCDGLRGVMYMAEMHYGIEPVENSTNGEHRLFQIQEPSGPSICGVGDIDTESSHSPLPVNFRLRRAKRSVLTTPSYVELGVVVDNLRYQADNSNMTAVEVETVLLINIVDSMFRYLNIRIVLISLTVFDQNNPFDVQSGTAGDVLGRFTNWKNQNTGLKRTDISHLLIGRGSYGAVIGMAFVGTVCSPSVDTSISAFSAGKTPQAHAPVVAHELGHNLGMSHDDTTCPGGYIMYSADIGAKNFSSCSATDFENLILRGGGACLKNLPDPSQVLSIPTCGNNIVETGEECDCGSPQECQNPCCQAATCKLTSGSKCGQGLCCENCQFKVAGTPCRSIADTCDLPEYCNGTYALCPVDEYIMNGFPCNNSRNYCYSGVCQNYDAQCRNLFGKDTRKAVDQCFQQANLLGDQYGNCGMAGNDYKKCATVDSLCGKLQCTGNPQPILNGKVQSLFANQDPSFPCLSVDFNQGPDVPDPGLVHQGTSCGDGLACVNYACVNATNLGYNCDVKTKCNDRGVCNNNGNCHCNYGWAPPYCDRVGYGGSIDSGPTHIDTSLRDGLLIFFLLVLPILILIIVVFIKRDALQRRFCKRWNRRRRANERRQQQQQQNNNATRSVPQSTARDKPATNFSDVFTISHNLPQRQPLPNMGPVPPPRPNLPPSRPPLPPRPPPIRNPDA